MHQHQILLPAIRSHISFPRFWAHQRVCFYFFQCLLARQVCCISPVVSRSDLVRHKDIIQIPPRLRQSLTNKLSILHITPETLVPSTRVSPLGRPRLCRYASVLRLMPTGLPAQGRLPSPCKSPVQWLATEFHFVDAFSVIVQKIDGNGEHLFTALARRLLGHRQTPFLCVAHRGSRDGPHGVRRVVLSQSFHPTLRTPRGQSHSTELQSLFCAVPIPPRDDKWLVSFPAQQKGQTASKCSLG